MIVGHSGASRAECSPCTIVQEWSWEMQNAKRKDYPEQLIATKYNETNSEDIDWQPAPRVTPDDVKGNVK
jgi:hypothetical protein